MPIEVYNIDNLFWDNNSYKVPNGLPNLRNKKFFDSSPVMIDYFTGYIDLYGDFNYCLYKDTYYILKQDKPIDINKNHWKYILIKDVWINLLKLGKIKVRGDAVIWNDEALLSKHLNKCLPTLDNPCSLHFLNFQQVDFNWRKHARIEQIDINISQTVLSAENLRWFKNSVNSDLVKRYRIAKNKWYPNNPQFFLFSRLQGTKLIKGWKQKAIDKINESLKDFQDTKKANKRRIVKVTQAPQGSPLNNLYAISYDSESLGTGEETGQQIEEISFKGLIDIVPIHWNTLEESIPTKPLNETTGIFNIQSDDIKNENFLWKIFRKAYLPIKTNKNNKNWLKPIGNKYQHSELSTLQIEPPQSITLKNGYHGYLWYVDKLDFVLNWFDKEKFSYSWRAVESKNIRDKYESYPFRFLKDNTIWPAYVYGSFNLHPDQTYYGYDYLNLSFFNVLKDKTPSYGWLIFQLLKQPQEWKKFEYLGNPKKSFEWFAGLKNNFLITFQDKKQWWSTIPKELSDIAGDDLFSKMHLHLDNFSWLAFAPSDKSYGYSYHSEDGFKHLSYVGNNRYTIYAMRADIKGNNITVVNPYNQDRIDDFLNKRISKLDSITIREKLEFPWEIKKGDYLISSLEYDIKDLTYTDEIKTWYSTEGGYTIEGNRGTKGSFYGALTPQQWTVEEGYLLDLSTNYPIFKPVTNREFLGDFRSLNIPIINPSDVEGQVFICSNTKGELEIRGSQTFSYNHFLNDGADQLIRAVDEGREKTINYVRLYRDGLAENIIEEGGFKTTHILEALYLFYKSNGYKVSYAQSVNTINLTWNWIDDEDFKSDKGLLFDLKGTAYYAFIRKDKVHLIIKEEQAKEIIKPLAIKINELKATAGNPEGLNHLKKISITEKINQRNILSIYTKPFQLKTKFTFEDSNRFNVTVKSLTPTAQKTGSNYFLISAHNSFDVIDEWVAIPKKPSEGLLNITDQFQYDSLALSISRARQDYDISKSRSVDFAYEKHNTAFERAKWDLQYQQMGAGIHLGLESVNILSSIGRGAIGINKALNSKRRPDLIGVSGHSMAMFNKVAGIIDNVKELALLYPEKARRIEEDREFAAREIAYNSFSIDLSHFRRKQDLLLQINSISNKYERTELNDFTLIEEYNKQNKIEIFNLRVYVPTEEQLQYLVAYREEFGVDCYIPDVELSLFVGMPPNVVRLLNIDDLGFIEVKNKLERDFLKARLKAGIKIVNIAGIKPRRVKKRDEIDLTTYVNQVQEAREETERIKQESEAKIKITTNKLRDLENSKVELNKKIDKLNKELEECKKGPGRDIAKLEELQQQKTALEQRIEKLEKEKEDLQIKLTEADKKLRETAQIAHNKEEELKKAQEALEACTHIIESDAAAQLTEKVKTLEKEKEDLQIKLNVEGNRYSQIFDQFEEAKRNLQTTIKEKEELESNILKQSEQITNLINKKEELEGQLLITSRQLTECKNQLQARQIQPSEIETKPLSTSVEELRECIYKQIQWILFRIFDKIYFEHEIENKKRVEKLSPEIFKNGSLNWGQFSTDTIEAKGTINKQDQIWKYNGFKLLNNIDINAIYSTEEKDRYDLNIKFITGEKYPKANNFATIVFQYLKSNTNPYYSDSAAFWLLVQEYAGSGILYLISKLQKKEVSEEDIPPQSKNYFNKFLENLENCFQNFKPISGSASGAELENIKRELSICKADKQASDNQITELNKAIEANQRTITNYRNHSNKQSQSITQLTNQVNLYKEEIKKSKEQNEQLKQELLECKNKACLIPDYTEYKTKYENLNNEQWHQQFNFQNSWRLKTSEFIKASLLIMDLYYQWKKNNKEQASKILRVVVEQIFLRSNEKRFHTAQQLPKLWIKLTGRDFDNIKNKSGLFFQYIRDSWEQKADTQNVTQITRIRSEFNNIITAVNGMEDADWDNEEKFLELGKKINIFLSYFIPIMKTARGYNMYTSYLNYIKD